MIDAAAFDALDHADGAAFRARQAWLASARTVKRKGKQIPPLDDEWQILLWRAGRGFGKLLDVRTPIPTPSGWTTMGAIQVGDTVFDESGRQVKVTWVSAEQSPLEAYRLTFSDGSTLDACADHQWVTWTHAERKAFLRSPYEQDRTLFPSEWPAWRLRTFQGGRSPARKELVEHALPFIKAGMSVRCAAHMVGMKDYVLMRHAVAGRFLPPQLPQTTSTGPQVRTTRQIVDTLTYGGRKDINHCIPQCLPLVSTDGDLPIPPYSLGVWLGDGTATDGSITAHLDDQSFICAELEREGFETRATSDPQRIGTGGLFRPLRLAGLFGNKHVPPGYLRASADTRLALLQGLMDSDGGVEGASTVSFTNTNKRLADNVYELIVSLGMRATRDDRVPKCNGKECARAYRVTFTPTMQVFRLPRKATLLSFDCAQMLRRRHRMIVKAERISSTPMRCIAVDGRHKMYLAGEAMIPTHNTLAENQWLWWECWRIPNIVGHVIAPTQADVRGTSFEGPAGLCSLIPSECLHRGSLEKAYNKSTHELRLSNGSLIRGFAATENGQRLRGPQCHVLAGDEIAAWDVPAGNLEQSMNNALLGLRLPYPDGTPARAVLGTTPRPIPYLKRLEKRDGIRVITGTSYENLANLSPSFRNQLLALAGTQAGRQEIEAAYLDEEGSAAIFRRAWMKLWPASKKLPEFSFLIEVYDTAQAEENYNTKRQTTDPTASIVLGVFNVAAVFTEEERRRMGVRSRYAALLCDAWAERLGFPDLLDRARAQHKIKWGTPGRKADVVLIEEKSSGISMRQTLVKYGVPTWPYNPGRQSKTMRAHAIAPLVKQGMLWVPESGRPDRAGLPRDWCEDFLEQVCAFAGPGSTEHDDYVDCLTSGMIYLKDRGMLEATPDEKTIDVEEKRLADQDEAVRVRDRERSRERGNPYAS